jgi:hypothetical protein
MDTLGWIWIYGTALMNRLANQVWQTAHSLRYLAAMRRGAEQDLQELNPQLFFDESGWKGLRKK